MKQKKTLFQLLQAFVILYILAAFTWWSILLYQKTQENYHLELQLREVHPTSVVYKSLEASYQSAKKMVIGEAVFFSLSILLGIYFVLRAFRKELEISTQKNNFILSVTHELKSPLAAMQLALQTMRKRKLNVEQKEMLIEQGLKETGRLNNLVNNILLAAKMDRSFEIHPEMVKLRPFIEHQMDHFKFLNSDQSIRIDIPKQLSIYADPSALESILHNLINNAIKFNPQVEEVAIKGEALLGGIQIIISDQGPGISSEERKKIFDKFYRLGNENTRNTSGSGLGLYLVQKLVLAHLGSINVQDNNPKGSSFKIYFPNE